MTNIDPAGRYERVADAIAATILPTMDRDTRMRNIVDAIWAEFGSHRPVSWVGFYLMGAGEMTVCKVIEDDAGIDLRVAGDWVKPWEVQHAG